MAKRKCVLGITMDLSHFTEILLVDELVEGAPSFPF